VHLASPAVVAASAVLGRLGSPEELGALPGSGACRSGQGGQAA
jgi:hypothetical protein